MLKFVCILLYFKFILKYFFYLATKKANSLIASNQPNQCFFVLSERLTIAKTWFYIITNPYIQQAHKWSNLDANILHGTHTHTHTHTHAHTHTHTYTHAHSKIIIHIPSDFYDINYCVVC